MFFLFVWVAGEQEGGMGDFEFAGTTVKDCKESLKRLEKVYEGYNIHYHIYDVFQNRIVDED